MERDGVLDSSVVFDQEQRTLDIHVDGRQVYRIDLDRCTSPAQILDWLMQVHHKRWCTPELFWKIVRRLDYAAQEVFGQGIQGVFCPSGSPQTANWKEAMRARKCA